LTFVAKDELLATQGFRGGQNKATASIGKKKFI
jgi:hypothetical protein